VRALILNYGVGNLFSISSALRRAGFDVEVNENLIGNYDLVVFPGVGTFKAVINYLRSKLEVINELRNSSTYFLGICIGMHVMFEYGFEGGINEGLKWLNGYVDRIRAADVKLPHIGWDKVYVLSNNELTEVLDDEYVYFMHSYIAYTDEPVAVFSYYGIKFPVTIIKDNLIAVQFHPERSGRVGIKFLTRLYRWLRR